MSTCTSRSSPALCPRRVCTSLVLPLSNPAFHLLPPLLSRVLVSLPGDSGSSLKRKQQAKEEAWKRQRAEEVAAKEAERVRAKPEAATAMATAPQAPAGRLVAPIVWAHSSSGGECGSVMLV